MTPEVITRQAHAKLNLFLEVSGKRPDGFHELETLMVRVDLADTLCFKLRSDGQILLKSVHSVSADSFPLGPENLVWQAAMLLREATHKRAGVQITVTKRIPSEAGLAGGSSNAAATLIALNDLWGCELSVAELHKLAARLGSDVNFFIEDCSAAVCLGRGELVTPIPMAQPNYAVAFRPVQGNATSAVFGGLDGKFGSRTSSALREELRSGPLKVQNDLLFNRLTNPARELNSQMDNLISEVQNCCGRSVHMSGSGSTCFVLAKSAREARTLAGQISHLNPEFLEVLQF